MKSECCVNIYLILNTAETMTAPLRRAPMHDNSEPSCLAKQKRRKRRSRTWVFHAMLSAVQKALLCQRVHKAIAYPSLGEDIARLLWVGFELAP